MIGKPVLHQINYLTRDCIGLKQPRRAQILWPRFTKALTILGIIIPLSPLGLTVISNKNIFATTKLAIKVFQSNRFSPFGMINEVLPRRIKMSVFAKFKFNPRL